MAQRQISARRRKRKVGTRQQIIIDEVGPTVAKGRSKEPLDEAIQNPSAARVWIASAFPKPSADKSLRS
ncbi:hypothetical protein ACVOMS_06670 [Bradyrhizobium guangxiense]